MAPATDAVLYSEVPRWRPLRRRRQRRDRSITMAMASRAHLAGIVRHGFDYEAIEAGVAAAVGPRAAAVYWAWRDHGG